MSLQNSLSFSLGPVSVTWAL